MKCQNCQFDNPPGMKFCGECGTKLELACPNCNAPNPPEFKFCGACGHNLSSRSDTARPKALSFDEKLAKIQKYLPGGLTEKILAQRDRIEGERRHVTIMFVDMKGFTPLTEKLGPEETFSLMDKVFELIIHKVHDYEGTVNELRGDGVLAFFGAPIALEDAPQRAIRSSLAIHRELTRFNEKLKSETKIPPVFVRIGINSGPVVVGTVGNDLRVQFTAVGDTINMAARMEQLAEPGTTCVTEDTFKLTEGFFRFEALGEKEIKGKEKPMKVYRVLGTGQSRSRFEARAKKGLTSFVGRDRELEIMWDCFERVRAGRGQALSIVSDAGMGKSRLLYEFRKSLGSEEVTFLEGRCLSYDQSRPYVPLTDILRDNFGIEINDGPEQIDQKVSERLKHLDIRVKPGVPYLLELLALENGFEIVTAADPEIKRRKTLEALRDLVLCGSQIRPLVMAIEDLHWVDKTSEETLKLLVDHIGGARVFLIFTFRSNYLPPWAGKSYHSQVNLNRLSNREGLQIISWLLNSEEIHEALANFILNRAEGVPFFIEELTRSLSESGAIMVDQGCCLVKTDSVPVGVPETVHDLLMARIDRLPEAVREVLQIGSVIEREFDWMLIKEVTGIPEMELLSYLGHLKEGELIYERGVFPQVSFIFQHAMTQEVLYGSLLEAKHKHHHQAIGTAMEKVYSDRLNEYSSILALHFTRGGDPKRGYRYHHLAGVKAAASYANLEALEHFREAHRLIDQWDLGEEKKAGQLDTALKMAEVMEPLGQFESSLALLEGVLDDPSLADSSRLSAKLHYWIGRTLGNLGRYDDARKHLLSSVELSQQSKSLETLGDAHNYLSQLDFFQGYLERALDHSEAAVRCLLEIGTPASMAWAQVFKGMIICDLRRENDCKETIEEAGSWIERSGDDRAQCLLTTVKCKYFDNTNQYEAMLNCATEGLELAERIGEGILTVALLGYAGLGALYVGKSDIALELFRRGELEGEKVGHPLVLALLRLFLARALVRLGMLEESREPAQAALHFCQGLGLGSILQAALEINAEILANLIPTEETRINQMMEQAAAIVTRSESPWYMIQHLLSKARVNLKLRRLRAACESLSTARCLYREIGLDDGTAELTSLEEASEKVAGQGGLDVCRE
jgi:class 3 adenylate cyclase/tetratricopeptide (TPR) repeat protein